MYRFFYLLLSVWATRVMVDWDSKWEIWNTFPSPRPVSGPFVQNLPIDRPMKNVSSVRLIGRVSSQKNLSLFSFELSHMREPYHQASLYSLSCVLENRDFERHICGSPNGFHRALHSCFDWEQLHFNILPFARYGTSQRKTEWQFFFPYILWNKVGIPLY